MRGVRPPSCRVVCHLGDGRWWDREKKHGATDEADHCGSYPRCGCGGLSYRAKLDRVQLRQGHSHTLSPPVSGDRKGASPRASAQSQPGPLTCGCARA